MNFMTFHSVGNGKSSQLTFTPSFFRGVGQPPARLSYQGIPVYSSCVQIPEIGLRDQNSRKS